MVAQAGSVPVATASPCCRAVPRDLRATAGGRQLGVGSVAHALTKFCSNFILPFQKSVLNHSGPPRGSSGQNRIVKHSSTFHTPTGGRGESHINTMAGYLHIRACSGGWQWAGSGLQTELGRRLSYIPGLESLQQHVAGGKPPGPGSQPEVKVSTLDVACFTSFGMFRWAAALGWTLRLLPFPGGLRIPCIEGKWRLELRSQKLVPSCSGFLCDLKNRFFQPLFPHLQGNGFI